MKSNPLNYTLLAVGVAAVMGISTGAMAATAAPVSAGAAPIANQATASYSVANVVQPVAVSNTVTVNVSETANFSLISLIDDGDNNNDTAINQTATPGGTTLFTHALTNQGNVVDTYTVNATGNDDPNITTATPNYNLGTLNPTTVAFTIVQTNGDALTPAQVTALNGQAQTGTIANGGTIRLQPGTRANLSYSAVTPDTRNGNDKGVGTLTATSRFFTTNNAANATLVNENQTIVRLPTFKIEKTAACNSGTTCSTLDLTAATPQIDYTIRVTNATTAYSAAATQIVIRDVLPLGMTLDGVVTAAGATVTSAGRTADGRTIIDVAVANLAVGGIQNITFRVNVNRAQYTSANSQATNNAAVYDKFVGPVGNNGVLPVAPVVGTDYNILDSTDNDIDVTRVPPAADQAGGAGIDSAPTTSFTRRNITLTNPTIREIAPTTSTTPGNTNGQVTQQTLITNLGQDVEGTNANPLTFTIADTTVNPNAAVDPIGPVTIVYTPPGGGAGTPITLTPVNGVYTINTTTLPSGIAPNGTVNINYNMGSTNAVIGSSETTIVTLTPAGNGAPTVAPVRDTTNVRGLTLLKQAAIQVNCTGTLSTYQGTLGVNSTITDTAAPGDCIFYRITANNTFAAGTPLTNVTISDSTNQWTSNGRVQAVYQNDAVGSSGATNTGLTGTGATQAVSTTFATLGGGASGTLTFSTKVNP